MNPHLHMWLDLFQLLVYLPVGGAVLYFLAFAVLGIFYRQSTYPAAGSFRKIAVLIPAYREDRVIVETARNALLQEYPPEDFEVIVIADTLQGETLRILRDMPVRVVEVAFEKSTKSKALNSAMAQLGDAFELAVILDADNQMASDFLRKINAFFTGDQIVVQGHRTAKNLDTSLAILDAVSEEINNHIFRKGHRVAGLSSAIIGSGMAFRYDFFREMMSGVDAVGGFDKDIELRMLSRGIRIGYLDDAWVFDEKVSRADAFSRQRRRWLSAQFHYFRRDILKAIAALFTSGNADYFDKALQFILPPRILLLGALILLSAVFGLWNLFAGNPALYNWIWLTTGILYAGSLLLSVPRRFYNRRTWKALAGIPRGMLLMVRSLAGIKGANREFIHTEHQVVKTK